MADVLLTLRKTVATKMEVDDRCHRTLHQIAADEIERLRAALQEIAGHGTIINKACGHARQMAREALNQQIAADK